MANITVWILGIELFHMMCMLIIVQSRAYATKMTEYINKAESAEQAARRMFLPFFVPLYGVLVWKGLIK